MIYSLFVNAINGVAWWMHQTFGPCQEFETLAYFGPWDIRYTLLLLGAIKAGYKMVFPSPGYSIAGLAVLLDELHCKIVIAPLASPAIVPAFLALHPRKLAIVQEIEELLAKTYPDFAFEETFESARHEPLVILHTSGNTSHPKPVVWTHDFAASGGVVSTALDALWLLISHANERCTKQAAMLKSHVLFTRPEEHLPKGFKGTMQRGAATRLYAEEMEALYT